MKQFILCIIAVLMTIGLNAQKVSSTKIYTTSNGRIHSSRKVYSNPNPQLAQNVKKIRTNEKWEKGYSIPTKDKESKQNTDAIVASPIIDTVPYVPSISSILSVSQEKHKNYHIIVASFVGNKKKMAEKLVGQLKSRGYQQALIYFSSGRYRVSIDHFSDKKDADIARNMYRKISEMQDAWITMH